MDRNYNNIELIGDILPYLTNSYLVLILEKNQKRIFVKDFFKNVVKINTIKTITNKKRPVNNTYGKKKRIKIIPTPRFGKGSFPSAHTCNMLFPTIFYKKYKGSKIKYYILLMLTLFTAYSRVKSHNHYISDIYGAVLISYYL